MPTSCGVAARSRLRRIAVLPAYNEASSVASVVHEVRRADPGIEILVVDDGSTDETAAAARVAGARVVRLPFNLGIGAAVQTGLRYALKEGFEIAFQVDADGQHDPIGLDGLAAPIIAGRADLVIGSRFGRHSTYRAPFARRMGIRLFAKIVSLLVGSRITDPTSGFRAFNRRAIELFACDYPHDYPEVESTVLVDRSGMRVVEVPVQMRPRLGGESSITRFRPAYYVAKVSVGILVGLLRRPLAAEGR